MNLSEKLLKSLTSLNEMANIHSNMLGFQVDTPLHFYKQSDYKEISHGPRVKVFQHDPDDGFSIKIGEKASFVGQVEGHGNGHLTSSQVKKLVNDMVLNRFAILEFFYNTGYRNSDFKKHVRSKDRESQLDRYIKYVKMLEDKGELKRDEYSSEDLEIFRSEF